MKSLGPLLAGVALIVASGVFVSARADDDRESLTLFTAAIHGTGFHCNTVNLSGKPLLIAMSIIDGNGNVLSPVPVPKPKNASGCERLKRYRTCTTGHRSVLQGSGIGHGRPQ